MNTAGKTSFNDGNRKDFEAGGLRFVNWIHRLLSGQDYDNGELETLQAGLEHSHEFIARLSLLLLEKGILSEADILKIVEPESLGYTAAGSYKWPQNNA